MDQETLDSKIHRPSGLCTSIGRKDSENLLIIYYILNVYTLGGALERASRTQEDWVTVHDLPMNFSEFRYRVKQ